ncbi:MAG: vitamin B12-dependent ribonucleotide reductase, partial [Acidobacteria bacterium]|nr:vitamin B12-dependent ribonucleotide reductase [Acidobacteriota bacterium]
MSTATTRESEALRPEPTPGFDGGDGVGIAFPRVFIRAGVDPFEDVEWETRSAVIGNDKGEVVFEQRGVEIPTRWSQQATNIVVSKYFRGQIGSPSRERSVRQLIGRVVDTIGRWAEEGGYFATPDDRQAFTDDLKYLLLHQKAAFNSPVWFNCGFEPKPQCSACFINSVEDTMESILTLARTEGMLFKFGSGTGTNLTPIRSSRELLAGGGTASGPVSFMKGYDAFAGVIKSGGKTRRAAKMVILNADHPDVLEFINCKVEEERKAWALIDAGYDGSLTGPAYASVFFQNSNNSLRVPDGFMRAVLDDGEWQTRAVSGDRRVVETHRARVLMRAVAEGAHVCGDPGMQFDTTVNDWHTCPNTARINASNPCSEYMFLDDSACNLASLNLMQFLKEREPGEFDVDRFRAAVRTLITAQEIIVGNASYPTDAIGRNSHDYRPLGLGYANLGALLMSRGVPYDSDDGRDYAAAITALMTGEAYAQSARIARDCGGSFSGYAKNEQPFLRVMRKHRDALKHVARAHVPADLHQAASDSWDDAIDLGESYGFRNAQATVLAPTGTIGFMMDCDTTGVEPDIALVKYKRLVGGGLMKIVNHTVPVALGRLGYPDDQINSIVQYVDEHDTIEGAPHLDSAHLAVFDCAFKPARGSRFIHYMGHLKMIGATQPFISGAISKTINVPTEATIEDVERAYLDAWRLGAKAVSIYRDGSKRTQPLNTSRQGEDGAPSEQPVRRKLPDERRAITHKFDIAGHEGYITVGLFDDGSPGEIFLVMAKEGSTISGFADAFAQAISYSLQYGVPLQVLVDKFSHQRFEPAGLTKNPDVRVAKSIVDYVFRWMATKFLSDEAQYHAGVNRREESAGEAAAEEQLTLNDAVAGRTAGSGEPSAAGHASQYAIQNDQDAPPCSTCGAIMIRNGACYKCVNCGATSGCA